MNLYSLRSILAAVFFVAYMFPAWSQQDFTFNYNARVLQSSGIPMDTINSVASRVKQALTDYNSYGTVFNPKTQKVDATSLNAFRDMFNLSSEVVNDISEPYIMMNASDFASFVYEEFPTTGINQRIYTAVIDNIRFDSAGYYLVDVYVGKEVYSQYKAKSKQGFVTKRPRCFSEKFVYDIPVDYAQPSRLQRIELLEMVKCPSSQPIADAGGIASPRKPTEPAALSIGPVVRLGYGFPSFDMQTFLDDPDRTVFYDGLGVDPGVSWGIGGRMQIPLGSTSNSVQLIVGLGFLSSSLSGSLDTLHYQFENEDGDGDEYVHDVRFSNLEEKIKLNSFEISPGVAIPIGQKMGKVQFMIDGQLLLRFNRVKGDIGGSGSYRGIYDEWEWTAFGPEFEEDYGYDNYTLAVESSSSMKVTPGIRVAPNLHIPLQNQGVIFHIGLEYEMLFGSVMKTNESADGDHMLRFRGEQETSEEGIVYNYFDKLGYWGISLRLGLLFNLNN